MNINPLSSAIPMRRLHACIRFFLICLFFYIAMLSLVSAEVAADKQLVVGSEEEYPPFSIGYADETADGFTVELWKAVAAKAKLDYVIRVRPFKTLLSDIKTGKVDVLINLAQSEDRKGFVDFTIPHVTVSGGIFVRKSTGNIRSENDLNGKEVIVLNGDLAQSYALTKPWGANLTLVDSASAGFNLLAAGKHDAMVISKLAGEKTIKQLQLDNVKLVDANLGFQQKFSFAVAKGNSDLLAKINEGMALVKESGEYDAIYNKWFAIYHIDPPLFSNAFYISIMFTVLAVLLAAYLFYIRVSERRQSLNLIREANKNFESVLSAASQFSIIATDLQGKITTFNTGASHLLGYRAEDVVGKLHIIQLHYRAELELRRAKQSEYFRRSLSEFEALVFKSLTGEFDKFDCEYVAKGGKRINVTVNISPVKNPEDLIIGYLFIAQDITERKKLEAAQVQYLDKLRQSEAHKSAILECAPDAIMIMNEDGYFVEFNPAAEKIFDYQRSEVIGRKLSDLIMPAANRARYEEEMKTYIKSGNSVILGRRIVITAMGRNHSEFQLEMTVVPFDLDDSQHFLAYARDVSNTKEP